MVKLTKDLLNGGAAPESDLIQAQTQLGYRARADTDIGVMRAEYEHAIAILIGKPPAEFTLAVSPLNLEPPVIPAGVPSQLVERRSRYRRQRAPVWERRTKASVSLARRISRAWS